MKVGDLVKISRNDSYWWGNQTGMLVEINDLDYTVWVPGKGHTSFTCRQFVKVIK